MNLNAIGMDARKPIMGTREQIQLMGAGLTHRMTVPDVAVEMRSSALPRVILDVQAHVQMLRRRDIWATDDSRLQMFDHDSQEDESCLAMVRHCGEQTAVHCMSLQSMLFYFDVLRLIRTYNQ